MSNSRQRPSDPPVSETIAIIEDPSGFKCKVISYSAGAWSREIHLKTFPNYGRSWSSAHMIMSPNEAASWLGRIEDIIESRPWEEAGAEITIRFWMNPSLNISEGRATGANYLSDPESFLIALRDVIQGLVDDMPA